MPDLINVLLLEAGLALTESPDCLSLINRKALVSYGEGELRVASKRD